MRAPPSDLDDSEIADQLHASWEIRVERIEYVPIGGGSHHWRATSAGGIHWVTVDDLDEKGFLGASREAALAGLRAAIETAVAVGNTGLDFVLLPVPATGGQRVRTLGGHYALALFPYIAGRTFAFHQTVPDELRERVLMMLARLHGVPATAAPAVRPAPLRPSSFRYLERALSEIDQGWRAGPLAEPARAVLRRHRDQLGGLMQEFERLARRIEAGPAGRVITHGEPHPANLIADGSSLLLIDWDTVALAPPERDLWWLASEPGSFSPYEEITGRAVDPVAIRLYRIRWALDDAGLFTNQLRAPHAGDPNTEHCLRALTVTLETLPQVRGEPLSA